MTTIGRSDKLFCTYLHRNIIHFRYVRLRLFEILALLLIRIKVFDSGCIMFRNVGDLIRANLK